MCDIENYLKNPLNFVQKCAAERKSISEICDWFRNILQQEEIADKIPCLNETAQDSLANNCLVKYRGMVQDMFGEELFPKHFKVSDSMDAVFERTGLFQDVYEYKEGERADFESAQMAERQCYYFVPIPAENAWVKDRYKSKRDLGQTSQSNYDNCNKRNIESDEEDSNSCEQLSQLSGDENHSMDVNEFTDSAKKIKLVAQDEKTGRISFNLNYPIDAEKETPCIGVFYEAHEGIKLNNTYEIYGILSNHPALAACTLDENGQENILEIEEMFAKSPPPSLAPRIHIVHIKKLGNAYPSFLQIKEVNLLEVSLKLRDYLQQVLLGDRIGADYLICHLISRVYARKDSRAIGKFSLNLTNMDITKKHTKFIYHAIEKILPMSVYYPLSLENMNKKKMTPYKDYKSNRLISGNLQLADRTHLVLDETALQPGQLDSTGVLNIRALNDVVCWQKLEYDFTYHKQEFFVDYPILVMSEGKSVFECDCRLPVKAVINPSSLETYYLQLLTMQENNMKEFRSFIQTVSRMDYTFPDDMKQEVEQYFVDMRRHENRMTADSFLNLLLFARLLTLSKGESALTSDVWDCAKALEQERSRRIQG